MGLRERLQKKPARGEVSTVVVPDVTGMDVKAAATLLRRRALVLAPEGPAITHGDVPRGQVISSDPPAGTALERRSVVTLTVSLGTVSDWLQSYIDGPSNAFNEVELPPGDHVLDKPLLIRRHRTKIRLSDKHGRNVARLSPRDHDPVFVFDDAFPVGDAVASVIYVDDPAYEITAKGRQERKDYVPPPPEG